MSRLLITISSHNHIDVIEKYNDTYYIYKCSLDEPIYKNNVDSTYSTINSSDTSDAMQTSIANHMNLEIAPDVGSVIPMYEIYLHVLSRENSKFKSSIKHPRTLIECINGFWFFICDSEDTGVVVKSKILNSDERDLYYSVTLGYHGVERTYEGVFLSRDFKLKIQKGDYIKLEGHRILLIDPKDPSARYYFEVKVTPLFTRSQHQEFLGRDVYLNEAGGYDDDDDYDDEDDEDREYFNDYVEDDDDYDGEDNDYED